MNAWLIVVAVFAAGCAGGLTNAAIAGEFRLPFTDPEARIYRPGWVGNVLVGGMAALVFWGLYGPMATAVLIGPPEISASAPTLRVSELFAALLTGIGGGRLLTTEIDRRLLERQRSALTATEDKLSDSVRNLAEGDRP